MKLRRLGTEDIGLAQAQVEMFWDVRPDKAVIRAFLADAANVFLSAEVDGAPAGQAIGYLLPRWDQPAGMAFLYSIDVDEAYQRQGIATRLLDLFLQIARETGCREGFVFTNASNAPAMGLYKKLGGVRPNPDDVMFDFDLAATTGQQV